MARTGKQYMRLTLARPIEQVERTIEVLADVSVPDPTSEHGYSRGPAESKKLKIQINVGRLLSAMGVKALNSSSGRSQEANGAIVVSVVR
jgi:hypothetical protein